MGFRLNNDENIHRCDACEIETEALAIFGPGCNCCDQAICQSCLEKALELIKQDNK